MVIKIRFKDNAESRPFSFNPLEMNDEEGKGEGPIYFPAFYYNYYFRN